MGVIANITVGASNLYIAPAGTALPTLTGAAAVSRHGHLVIQSRSLAVRPDELENDFGAQRIRAASAKNTALRWCAEPDRDAAIAVDDLLCEAIEDSCLCGCIGTAIDESVSGWVLVPTVHTSAHEGRSGIAPTRR